MATIYSSPQEPEGVNKQWFILVLATITKKLWGRFNKVFGEAKKIREDEESQPLEPGPDGRIHPKEVVYYEEVIIRNGKEYTVLVTESRF